LLLGFRQPLGRLPERLVFDLTLNRQGLGGWWRHGGPQFIEPLFLQGGSLRSRSRLRLRGLARRAPYFENVFCGSMVGQRIYGIWLDLPTNDVRGGGQLVLRVESPSRFVKVSSSANYGSEVWTREGAAPPQGSSPQPPPQQPQQVPMPTLSPQASGEITMPAAMTFEADNGVRGTWTSTNSPIRYDAVYVDANGRRITAAENVAPMGASFLATRAFSSDGSMCRLQGRATQINPLILEGTGDCYDNRQWRWKLTATSSGAAPAATAAGGGLIWESEGWTGTWTRRGTSNVYDSQYSGPGGERKSAVEIVTITGNQVVVQRTNPSDGITCTLTGQVQASPLLMQGYAECSNGARGWWWRVRAP
jgi:hypothetical protein